MNQQEVLDICNWVETHPDHVEDCDEDKPNRLFLWVCLNFDSNVFDYEDPASGAMSGVRTENGCTYVFKGGHRMTCRCNVTPVSGTTRCSFHNAVIFSEKFRDYLDTIN